MWIKQYSYGIIEIFRLFNLLFCKNCDHGSFNFDNLLTTSSFFAILSNRNYHNTIPFRFNNWLRTVHFCDCTLLCNRFQLSWTRYSCRTFELDSKVLQITFGSVSNIWCTLLMLLSIVNVYERSLSNQLQLTGRLEIDYTRC